MVQGVLGNHEAVACHEISLQTGYAQVFEILLIFPIVSLSIREGREMEET